MNKIPDWLKHVSFSGLTAYDNCPRCFYLKYRMKIWETEKSLALIFGGALHDAIASYHGWEKPAWKIRLDGECPEEIKKEIEPYIEMYKKMFTPDADYIEKEFLIDFIHPDTKKSLGIPLKGFIDKIHKGYVIDHKATSSRITKRETHDSKQLTLYSYAYRKLFGKKEKGLKINAFLKRKQKLYRSLEVIETTRDNSDYADVWIWAKGIVDRICAREFKRSKQPEDRWFKHLLVCA